MTRFLWLVILSPLALLLVIVLLVVAVRVSRRGQKVIWGCGALLVLVASCVGLYEVAYYHPPLVNVPAPVPASLTLLVGHSENVNSLKVSAMRARDGSPGWQQTFAPAPADLLVVGNVLYMTGFDSTSAKNVISALSARDGSRLWRTSLTTHVSTAGVSSALVGPPVAADGFLYVLESNGPSANGTGQVFALRATDGSVAWSQVLENFASSAGRQTLAAGGGLVFVSSAGSVRALSASTGALAWQVQIGQSDERNKLALADGILYVQPGTFPSPVVALRASDGTLLWRLTQVKTESIYSLTVTNGHLYVVDFETNSEGGESIYLEAFDARNGHFLWKAPVVNPGAGEAVEAGGTVYFASDHYLDAFRVSNGHRLWRHQSNANVGFGAPVIFQGVLFVPTFVVYPHYIVSCPDDCEPPEAIDALSVTDGSLYWRVAVPGILSLDLLNDNA